MSLSLPQVVPLFQRRWSVFWATTYAFELELFDNFLLRRLGDPPLNATVLADPGRLAQTLSLVPVEESWRLRRINRDYLVRGYPIPSGRFHPKTYFFADSRQGVLLVGSGNLSRHGLDRGHEVFCEFHSDTTEGQAAIGAWRVWMQRLVEAFDDDVVRHRWAKVRTDLPWLPWLEQGPASGAFVHNLETDLLSQLVAGFDKVAEIHAAAPFFDQHAEALRRLIRQTQPNSLTLYAGEHLNVDGNSLVEALSSVPKPRLLSYGGEFVHAKLIALVGQDKARVLSGSANLSQAALLLRGMTDPGANIEAGILYEGMPDEVREIFPASDLQLEEMDLSSLSEHVYEPPAEGERLLRLVSARQLGDGAIEIAMDEDPPSGAILTNGLARAELNGRRTAVALPLDAFRLVWIADRDGAPLSNGVAVDDPEALSRYLREREQTHHGPRELDGGELGTPIGEMLSQLNASYVFDVEDTRAVTRAQQHGDAEAEGSGEDAAFWGRLAREELQQDPRAEAYDRYSRADYSTDDELFEQLRMMLDRTPEDATRAAGGQLQGGNRTGQPWTPERRLQVRLGNVLERWSRKVADARLLWIAPTAPARNYAALLKAMAECCERGWVPRERLTNILHTLMSTFIVRGDGHGLLETLGEDDRREMLDVLDPTAASFGAMFAYLVLGHREGWQEHVFEWQVFLRPGLAWGAIAPNEEAAIFASVVSDEAVNEAQLKQRLEAAATHIDDEHWCADMKAAFEFDHVRLTQEGFRASLSMRVGIADLLNDPRLVGLVRQALSYRSAQEMVLVVDRQNSEDGDRLSVGLGRRVFARIGGSEDYASRDVMTDADLEALEEEGIPWGQILRPAA